MVSKKLDRVHNYMIEKGLEKEVQETDAIVDFLAYFKDFWIQFCM